MCVAGLVLGALIAPLMLTCHQTCRVQVPPAAAQIEKQHPLQPSGAACLGLCLAQAACSDARLTSPGGWPAGAQWEKAAELFEQMQTRGCKPDSVTYGGLILAYEKGGQWRKALAAFEQMKQNNCRPDSVVYNTTVGLLWNTGVVWAQAKAIEVSCSNNSFVSNLLGSNSGQGRNKLW